MTQADASLLEGKLIVLMLDNNGHIQSCSTAAGKLLGYMTGELLWLHISELIPQLRKTSLMQDGQVNKRLLYMARVGYRFQLAAKDGANINGQLFITDSETSGRHGLRLIFCPDPL